MDGGLVRSARLEPGDSSGRAGHRTERPDSTATMDTPPVLTVPLTTSGLTKSFGGVLALDSIDFRAEPGQIHGLLGENGAGKSTFIKLIAGVLRADAGEIRLGAELLGHGAGLERGSRVAAVFQELSLIPDFTVAENIWIRQEPLSRIGRVSNRAMRRKTEELFDELQIQGINPDREVRLLSVAERHLVETVKALSTRPQVIILDETTSALGPRETEWLVAQARALADAGRIVLYISHRLAEIRDTADCITVFRGGKNVGTRARGKYDEDELITMMLARQLESLFPSKDWRPSSNVVLRVRGLGDGYRLRNLDLDLHEGEIVGIGGLQGQGQAQLFLTLYGAHPMREGVIELMGKPVRIRNVRDALSTQIGLALVPEDRRRQGLLLTKPLRENITLAVLNRLARFGVIDRRREAGTVSDAISRFQIVARGPEQEVQWLSGGNQQKVLIAKLLLTNARVLLLFDVTRGIDVGTRPQIFAFMRELARQGCSILFYSTDASELAHMTDRVAVMAEGRIVATLRGSNLTEESILRAAVQAGGRNG
jgi:ribose transport system ATP-binding protein